MVVHWGAPVPVADSVVRAPHSLLRQCTDAREQSSGGTNPDGWGIGWYVDGQADPYRYRTDIPMTDDHDGVASLDGLEVGRFVAHARHKSPGSPTEVAGNAPFVSGRWLFAHNGYVEHFRDGVRDELFAQLSPDRQETLAGDADSELLFGLVLDRIDAGDDTGAALATVLEPLARDGGRYNIVLTDGDRLWATRVRNSLYRRRDDTGRTVELASEPYDERGGWEPVDDHTLIEIDANGIGHDTRWTEKTP